MEETYKSEGNLGMMEYGKIDKIITSPPYENQVHPARGGINAREPDFMFSLNGYSKSKENIGNLSHGKIDKIISSPPYGDTFSPREGGEIKPEWGNHREKRSKINFSYNPDNLNNLSNISYDEGEKSYLSEMLLVYAECNKVLKSGGLLILVTKNFIRDGVQIRLDEDTIRLCQVCGFELLTRHYRKLTSESFWRTIYRRKWKKEHPDRECPIPTHEDVLVFRKAVKDAMPF